MPNALDQLTAAVAAVAAEHQQLQALSAKQAARIAELEAKAAGNGPAPKPPVIQLPPPAGPEFRGLGLNLTEHTDYTPGAAFADLAHALRRIESMDGKSVYTGPFGANGYPLAPCRTCVHLYDYPDGDYPLSFKGAAIINVSGVGKLSLDGKFININKARANGGKPILWLTFSGLVAAAPFGELSIRMPGAPAGETFNPAWLEPVKAAKAIRFMDWGEANANDVIDWVERTQPSALVQTGYWFPRNVSRAARTGVAYEYWIELCTLTGRPAWINVPGLASDDYVRQMAVLFRDAYPKSLPLIVECDNEPWNTDPRFSGQRVKARADAASRSHPRQIAFELLRVARLFREVWGNESDRLKFVLGSQASNPWVTTEALKEIAAAGKPSDLIYAVAIAPYIGVPYTDPDGYADALIKKCVETWPKIAEHKNATEAAGLKLWAYEGGTHPDTEQQAIVATTHPRMGEFMAAYKAFLDRNLGPDALSCYFCGPYDAKWGLAPSADKRGAKYDVAMKIFSAGTSS